MKNQLTVERANEIQDAWMKLSCEDTEHTKQSVYKMMSELPRSHITYSEAHKNSQLMMFGQPTHAFREPLAHSVARAKSLGIQTQLVWLQSGRWVNIESIN